MEYTYVVPYLSSICMISILNVYSQIDMDK